jgi:hypothetical protein
VFSVKTTRTYVPRPLLPTLFVELADKQQFFENSVLFFLAMIRVINCFFPAELLCYE